MVFLKSDICEKMQLTFLIRQIVCTFMLLFNMITGINELKILTKHISCECKCKFDLKQCN